MRPDVVQGLEGLVGTNERLYHNVKESIYRLPTDPGENDRLEQQHRLVLHLFGGPFAVEGADEVLKNGGSVVDVGCGPGSWIKCIANLYPEATVHATDFAPTFLPSRDGSASDRVDFVVGDVLKGLPYEDGSFDFAQMRFFTGALKTSEWPMAVKELHRIVKPGGFVQLIEPDGELHCRDGRSAVIEDWNARGLRGTLSKRGGDPNVSQRLSTLLLEAGFTSPSVRIASAPIDARSGGPLGALMERDYLTLIKTLAPVLAVSWGVTDDESNEWGERVVAECREKGAFHNFVCAVARR